MVSETIALSAELRTHLNSGLYLRLVSIVLIFGYSDIYAKSGSEVYKTTCIRCHKTGLGGAPRFGNKKSWAKVFRHKKEWAYNSVLHGKGLMPPKGGNPDLSDEEVKAAADYMINSVK